MMDSAAQILREAISEICPTHIVSMVSGGKDSAASHAVAEELGARIELTVHGNTRCGIPETSEFVGQHYGNRGPDYVVADAGTAYEDYVLRKGFFGKGIAAHSFAYRVLKATPFRKAISRCIRQGKRGIRVLLVNGARKDESENRRANLQICRRDPAQPNNVWISPLYHWSAADRDDYIRTRNLTINPVAQALCRSGECMCGTMQSDAERTEAAVLYPRWGRWLANLEAEVRARHGFGWGEPFPRKRAVKSAVFQPMCSDCTARGEAA